MVYSFKYFDLPLINAEFIDGEECQSCRSNMHCLDGEYFDLDDNIISVCLSCLQQGIQKVNIPNYIKDRVTDIGKEEKIEELEKTPPVPWIQFNDWPVCCDDFTKYLGEWDQKDFEKYSERGIDYLLSILEQPIKERITDIDSFWQNIGHHTAIFTFECLFCTKRIAIPQNY